MAETLFPTRQRCKRCSHKLPAQGAVFSGLFCSPKCAGIAEPAQFAKNAPRECRTQRDGQVVFKRRYRSEGEIPDRIKQDPSASWYWCSHCAHLHMGHTRMGERESLRMLRCPQDLADALVKLRGRATVKDVAAAAGVRPIRLKELENPTSEQRVDIDALFAVLDVYRCRAGIAFSTNGAGSR